MSTSGSVNLQASVSSLGKSQSIRSSQRAGPSTIKTVVTSPPWARDEPPSPTDQTLLSTTDHSIGHRPSTSRRSHSPGFSITTTSVNRTYGQDDGPSWWTFARRTKDGLPSFRTPLRPNWPALPKAGKRIKERSRTWLSSHRNSQEVPHDIEQPEPEDRDDCRERWDIQIPLSTPGGPFTVAQAQTPGWESPWSPRVPEYALVREDGNRLPPINLDTTGENAGEKEDDDPLRGKSDWSKRRKRMRYIILNHPYVPLVFRLVNLTFTTAALAIAIRIRKVESRLHLMGAVGSSPTLVIIFAPFTLMHVMAAIYLEYFGRPLGLWRTSMKLAHTLSETVFICVWSAALSLTFDNYFTSVIGCASASTISWYNQIPRPVPDLPDLGRGTNGPADTICDEQLALICLVGVGLIMYCTSLVISLFRIFEKVKNQPSSMR